MNDNLYTVPQYALEHMQSKYRRAVTRNYPALGVNAGSIGFLSTTAGSSGDTTYSNQQETPSAMPYSLADGDQSWLQRKRGDELCGSTTDEQKTQHDEKNKILCDFDHLPDIAEKGYRGQ
jgi:hypothetical protein